MSKIPTIENDFEKFLVSEYFRHGSIEKVYKVHNYNLPISFASYHRLLNKFQVVKSAGPNSKLSESLHVLSLLNTYKLPLERIYHKYSPASLQVSTNTLHRVFHNIRLGVTTRVGVALLISSSDNPNNFLLGQDNSLVNPTLGQKGDWSLPMGYTREQDSFETGINRVLQQEVFTDLSISNNFPKRIFPSTINPEFIINIADIKVYVFRIILRKSYNFSSFKLSNFNFYTSSEISCLKARGGVVDIVERFNISPKMSSQNSKFNQNLCLLPLKAKIR